MKVKELIDELLKFNQDAEVTVTAHCKKENFTITYGYGDGEGITKDKCSEVSIYVDRLCSNEHQDN